jgi:hypothetical protein
MINQDIAIQQSLTGLNSPSTIVALSFLSRVIPQTTFSTKLFVGMDNTKPLPPSKLHLRASYS